MKKTPLFNYPDPLLNGALPKPENPNFGYPPNISLRFGNPKAKLRDCKDSS